MTNAPADGTSDPSVVLQAIDDIRQELWEQERRYEIETPGGHGTAITVSGLPGAGKSVASEAIREKLDASVEQSVTAASIGEAVNERALENIDTSVDKPTNELVGEWATTARKHKHDGYMADLAIDHFDLADADVAVIDGVRSPAELGRLKDVFSAVANIYLHAPKIVRHRRIIDRADAGDEHSRTGLNRRDDRERSWGLAAIKSRREWAYEIENFDLTKDEFRTLCRSTAKALYTKYGQ